MDLPSKMDGYFFTGSVQVTRAKAQRVGGMAVQKIFIWCDQKLSSRL